MKELINELRLREYDLSTQLKNIHGFGTKEHHFVSGRMQELRTIIRFIEEKHYDTHTINRTTTTNII